MPPLSIPAQALTRRVFLLNQLGGMETKNRPWDSGSFLFGVSVCLLATWGPTVL